jgi:hypothetical protein
MHFFFFFFFSFFFFFFCLICRYRADGKMTDLAPHLYFDPVEVAEKKLKAMTSHSSLLSKHEIWKKQFWRIGLGLLSVRRQ